MATLVKLVRPSSKKPFKEKSTKQVQDVLKALHKAKDELDHLPAKDRSDAGYNTMYLVY